MQSASEAGHLCNPNVTLPFSGASLSLFGKTLGSTGLGGYIIDSTTAGSPQLCLTAGSPSLPSGWALASVPLSDSADLCFTVTSSSTGAFRLGLPISGQLVVTNISLPFGNPDSSVAYELQIRFVGSTSPSLQITLEPMSTPSSSPYVVATVDAVLSGGTVTSCSGTTSTATALTVTGCASVFNLWASVAALPQAREFAAVAALPNGLVLVAGGSGSTGRPLATASLYDVAKGTWASAARMPVARSGLSSASLAGGRVLVVGGGNNALIYDSAHDSWTQTGGTSAPFAFESLASLGNGDVLAVGGASEVGSTGMAELYNGATGKWKNAGSLAQASIGAAIAILSNGQALVAGGSQLGLDHSGGVMASSSDTGSEVFSLTSVTAPAKGATPPGGPTVVPSAHTGEPWAGWTYWLLVGGIGCLGLAFVEESIRRYRRYRSVR